MTKSIKTKITFITIGIFVVFNLIIIAQQINSYLNYKQLRLDVYNAKVSSFKNHIERVTENLINLAQALSVIGKTYPYLGRNDAEDLSYAVGNNLNDIDEANGCGIWFEPNIISGKKRFFSYVHREANELKIETQGRYPTYNYFENDWYSEAIKILDPKNEKAIYWSRPYRAPLADNMYMITVSSLVFTEDKGIIGVASADWLLNDAIKEFYNIAPTDDSIVLLANTKKNVVVGFKEANTPRHELKYSEYIGKPLKSLKWYSDELKHGSSIKIGDNRFKTFISEVDDNLSLILLVPRSAIYGVQFRNTIIGIVLQLLGTLILAYFVHKLLINNLNKPIDVLVDATKKIGQGDFDTKIQLKEPTEFVQLADTINGMTVEIKEYLENIKNLSLDKERIEVDLNVAKEIQESSLPLIYPKFYNIPSIHISPYMDMATKVGGDFYNFFFVGKHFISFVVADVSGKGIPAALFMMSAKAILKGTILADIDLKRAVKDANILLCSNNEKELFVTAGIGIIDLKTGEVTYLNAGHTYPVIKHGDKVEFLKVPANMVLGAFEDIEFETIKFKLNPMDTLFLYSDGVTEARNPEHELYGEERLLACIQQEQNSYKDVTNVVKSAIREFINNAEQADDITMLGITYLGVDNISLNKRFRCRSEEFVVFKNWLQEFASNAKIDNSKLDKLYIAAEEVFVNICDYAYSAQVPDKAKLIDVGLKYIRTENLIQLVFIDTGLEFNPLESESPDIDLDISERGDGGMGIMLVKNMMNDVEYEYKRKHNVLKLAYKIS